MAINTTDGPLTKSEREIYCARRYLPVLIEDDAVFMAEQGRLLKAFGAWMETTWGGVGHLRMKDRLGATTDHYEGMQRRLVGEAKLHDLHKGRGRPTNAERGLAPHADDVVMKWPGRG